MKRLISALFLVLLAIGCSGSKDDKPKDDGPRVMDKGERPPPPKADFSMTSIQFFDEYKKNREAAETKYLGKNIELTGVAVRVGEGLIGPWINLEAPGEYRHVDCAVKEPQIWKRVFPGQTVKLIGRREKGQFEGKDDVELTAVQVLEVTGPASPTVNAVDLAKEYKADPKATLEKYAGTVLTPSKNEYQKGIILAGEVEKIEPIEVGRKFYLKTGMASPQVTCTFEAPSVSPSKAIKVGDTIKAVGRLEEERGKAKGDVGISFGLLFEGPK